MTKRTSKIECLAWAQAFETYWAYYTQSSGQLYGEECRTMLIGFIKSYESLSTLDRRMRNLKHLRLNEEFDVDGMLQHLKEWAEKRLSRPYEDVFESRLKPFVFLAGLKSALLLDLGVTNRPRMTLDTTEQAYSSRAIRWRAHLPVPILEENPDAVFDQASATPTIAVVGDIRRSQDLMTYAQYPKDFSERMVEFITRTRSIIETHGGFFDKFTGDGFIVYFNEAVSKAVNLNYLNSFLAFLGDELSFAASHFRVWSKSIRKHPATDIGLALGADIGCVRFEDINNHLIAVGDAIVWASRMASMANGNEVIVNNLLFATLEGRQGISFEKRVGQTKAGESFWAHALTLGYARKQVDT